MQCLKLPTNTWSVYDDLEAAVLPIMDGHQADLTKWDKAELDKYPNRPFLHYARHSSTYLVLMPTADDEYYPPKGKCVKYLFGAADRCHILDQKLVMAVYFTKPENGIAEVCHHYDGERLRKVSLDKAVEIVRKYKSKVESAWGRWGRQPTTDGLYEC